MRITPRGYEATLGRYREIQARLDSLSPKPPLRTFGRASQGRQGMPPALSGSISRLGSNAPLDPFGSGMGVTGATTELKALARDAAIRAGVDPVLFDSLVSCESGYNPRAVSAAGAQGLCQLMPATARGLGVSDSFDPAQNLDGGARYLAQMLREFGGDERLAVAAYNAGPGAVRRYGGIPPFAETQAYVQRVLSGAALGRTP